MINRLKEIEPNYTKVYGGEYIYYDLPAINMLQVGPFRVKKTIGDFVVGSMIELYQDRWNQ